MNPEQTDRFTITVHGTSMAPTIRNHDQVTIEPIPPHSLKKGDVIMALTGDGRPVVHRIIQVNDSGDGRTFFTSGDNVSDSERLNENQISGRVTTVHRNGTRYRLTDPPLNLLQRFLGLASNLHSLIYPAMARFKSRLKQVHNVVFRQD